jgi:hypothetical protein
MELWCVLSASSAKQFAKVPAFYARCLSSGKPIAKNFPTPGWEENKEPDRRNYSILLEVRLEKNCLCRCPAVQDKGKTIPQSSKARAIRGRHESLRGRQAKVLWFINKRT